MRFTNNADLSLPFFGPRRSLNVVFRWPRGPPKIPNGLGLVRPRLVGSGIVLLGMFPAPGTCEVCEQCRFVASGYHGSEGGELTKYHNLYLSKMIIFNIEGRYLLINILIDYQYLLLNQIKFNLHSSLLKKIEFESYSLGIFA